MYNKQMEIAHLCCTIIYFVSMLHNLPITKWK